MDAQIMIRTILVAALSCVALGGCSSPGKTKPSCPVPDGTRCMSTLDVYEATHASDSVGQGAAKKDVLTPNEALASGGPEWGTRIEGDTLALAPAHPVRERSTTARLIDPSRPSEPYREPAKVMRIYISAWEDEQGDLHAPSFIFSEIQARRWSTGERQLDSATTFRLLEAPGEAAQDARAAADSPADAGRRGQRGTPNLTERNHP